MDPEIETSIETEEAPSAFVVHHALHRPSIWRRARRGSLVAGQNEVAFVPFLDAQPQEIHTYEAIRHAEVTRGWRGSCLTLHTSEGTRHFRCRATEEEITAMAAFVVDRLAEPGKRALRPRYRLTRLAGLRAPFEDRFDVRAPAADTTRTPAPATPAIETEEPACEDTIRSTGLVRRIEGKVRRDWKVLAIILVLMVAEGWWFYRLIFDEPSPPVRAAPPIEVPQFAGPPGEPAEPAAGNHDEPRLLVRLLETLDDEGRRAELGKFFMERRISLDRTREDVAASIGWSPERLEGVEERGARIELVQLGALAMTLELEFDMLAMEDRP